MKKILTLGLLFLNIENIFALTSQASLNIPEPMVFDLVRPLGAPKGELEINMLSTKYHEDEVEFSPEIEYQLFDGFGVEAELGIIEKKLSIYKLAIQNTFTKSFYKDSVQGWQFITLYDKNINRNVSSLLYLLATRIYGPASAMFMIGAETGNKGGTAFLLNPTLFYNVNSKLSFGIENNTYINDSYRVQLIPQMNLILDNNWSVQTGFGARWQKHHQIESVFALRLIYSITDHPG